MLATYSSFRYGFYDTVNQQYLGWRERNQLWYNVIFCQQTGGNDMHLNLSATKCNSDCNLTSQLQTHMQS